jgi:hypothetical protein
MLSPISSSITLYLHTHTQTDTNTGSFQQNMALENDSDLFLTDVCGVTSTTTFSQLGSQILLRVVYLLTSQKKYTQSLIQRHCLLASICGGMSGVTIYQTRH